MDCYCENIDAVMVVVGGVTYCDTIETVAPSCTTTTCPTGYTLIDGVCQLDSEGTSLCLEGGIYDPLTETCTYTESVLAKCTCTADVVASPQTICSGEETNIILTSTSPGITYNWTVVQGGVTGASSGTGNVISQVLTGVGSVTYIITPSEIEGGCQGEPKNVLVTVKAGTNLVATPSTPQDIQSGDIVSIGLSSSTPGTTFSWTVTADVGITGATPGTGATITNTLTATNSGSVVYNIVATSSNGCSNTLEYTVNVEAEAIELEPFDYMIVTYNYDNTGSDANGRDLDSATTFQNTGTVEDNKFIGCGQPNIYSTPTTSTPINDAYLYQNGDDVGNGQGESIVINFKNIETAGISLNNDVRVELYAGWCDPAINNLANVSVVTYLGGTLTLTPLLNTITSTGTVVDSFSSSNIEVMMGCCAANPLTSKTHIGTIFYNLSTKVASVTFN